jgi:hypothetical protein
MDRGYIKLWRRIQDSKLWLSEPFTRGQAWIDLIGLANYKDGYFRIRGNRVDVKRGQCGYSELSLSARWRWSRGKVNRFLNELETEQQIIQQKTRLTTLITIINYDLYQTNNTTDRATGDTTDGQQTDINNKDKNNIIHPIVPQKEEPNHLPEWLNKELWKEFKSMRSRIKKPITTQRTVTNLISGLKAIIDQGYPQDIIIQEAIDCCWQKFYVPKNIQHKQKPNLNDCY